MTMRINAPKGQKVKFLNKNGYEGQKEYASIFLSTDKEYTVDYTRVFSSSSRVCLEEEPDKEFNTVMFEEVGEILPEVMSSMELYNTEYPIIRKVEDTD